MSFILYNSDCLEQLKLLEDNSVDSIVTDPPYGLSFMGKKWDYDVPSEEIWAECLRVLKPGGHLLAFAGTRTQHRMAVRIEDAGFEIRDMIAWVYGSGFPKSHNISKALEKNVYVQASDLQGVENESEKWQGWGTALKPALEPITVARKPIIGTVAENVLAHGTGALNIDGCRVGRANYDVSGWSKTGSSASENRAMSGANYARAAKPDNSGRWPANLIHDGSDEVVGLFPYMLGAGNKKPSPSSSGIFNVGRPALRNTHNDNGGSAARFFYVPKASKRDRDEHVATHGNPNKHVTVKPTDLMRYLCRLVTPPNGVVLDPFMGSGSTGKAAMLEGFQFIGIEREAEYVEIAKARIENALNQNQEIEDDKQMTFL